MYEYFYGKLQYKSLEYVVIDINGIGYRINIPFKTYEKLEKIDENYKLYIHTSIRENDISYYGFYSKLEKEVFQTIISISGIGPKIGLAILSRYNVDEIINIIRENDKKRIEEVNGLGKAKSGVLIASLQNKFEKFINSEYAINLFEEDNKLSYLSVKQDVSLALESLGFGNIKISKYMTDEEIKEINDSSKIMKEILKRMNRK